MNRRLRFLANSAVGLYLTAAALERLADQCVAIVDRRRGSAPCTVKPSTPGDKLVAVPLEPAGPRCPICKDLFSGEAHLHDEALALEFAWRDGAVLVGRASVLVPDLSAED